MSENSPPSSTTRFSAALRRFDEANSRDPNVQTVNGSSLPRELAYARWLSDWVLRLCPNASEALRLAARCQHLCRWRIPRNEYPMTRAGYLQWRTVLKQFHADTAGNILREVGYPEDIIRRVQELNLKRHFPHDPESRVLEDALCLVFLEHQLSDLVLKTSEDKVVNALRKSWQKMTAAAHAEALRLPYGPREQRLLNLALTTSD